MSLSWRAPPYSSYPRRPAVGSSERERVKGSSPRKATGSLLHHLDEVTDDAKIAPINGRILDVDDAIELTEAQSIKSVLLRLSSADATTCLLDFHRLIIP